MRKAFSTQHSEYLDNDFRNKRSVYTTFNKGISKTLISLSMSVLILIAIISSLISPTIIANAAEDYDDLASDYGLEQTTDSFLEGLDRSSSDTDPDSFAQVFQRLVSAHYLNDVSDGVASSGYSKPSSGMLCDVNDPNAGTLLYHNCDIPNITAEFFQDVLSLYVTSGASADAQVTSNKMFANYALPTGLGEIPINPDDRSIKYTAYEIYGYNLKYTSYYGEWDHIKVLNSARTMSNFGLMDNIRLGASAVVDGVTAALNTVVNNVGNALKNKDILSAVGALFSGGESGVSAGVNTILDTSDLNVANTNAWYRVNYSNTLYGARELTDIEISALLMQSFYDMITQNSPENATLPDDFVSISGGPPEPLEAISSCIYLNSDGEKVELTGYDNPPGVTEGTCSARADYAYSSRVIKAENNGQDASTVAESWYEYDPEGKQQAETLQEWYDNNKNYFDISAAYGMTCQVNVNSTDPSTEVSELQSCWSTEWARVSNELLYDIQSKNNTDWWAERLQEHQMRKWYSDPANNFNAPWNRYICLNPDGSDMITNGSFVYLYSSNGDLNSLCSEVRSPVQNGVFGNGYTKYQEKPEPDTRFSFENTTILSVFLQMQSDFRNSLANNLLTFSGFVNSISNFMIKLSFGEPLTHLGLKDLMVNLITSFKNSLFMPLSLLVIAIGGIQLLVEAGRRKNYSQQFKSILFILLTYITGLALMYNPEATINAVEAVPSKVESAVLGLAFNIGYEDTNQICTATSSLTSNSANYFSINGDLLSYNTDDSVRNLMCENWRVFVFNTWVNGQWGTGYNNLYSAESASITKMNNTNGDLVGDASVNLGAGIIERNWALYQLDVTTSGTTTSTDPYAVSGKVSPDFYRIVDMQAGPNNGEGTDSRYFSAWSGSMGNNSTRLETTFLGTIATVIGAVTVISYSASKIFVTTMASLMVLLLPFVFLIGLHPTQGRSKLKAYMGTILGLLMQRIILVVMLIIMLRLLMAFGNSSENFILNGIFLIIICVVFLKYKKEVLGEVERAFDGKMGSFMGGEGYRGNFDRLMGFAPKSVQNLYYEGSAKVTGAAGGFIAGYITGGVDSNGNRISRLDAARNLAGQAAHIEGNKEKRNQRRKGFGLLRTFDNASDTVRDDLKRKVLNENESIQDLREKTLIPNGLDHDALTPKITRDLMDLEKKYQELQDVNYEKLLDQKDNHLTDIERKDLEERYSTKLEEYKEFQRDILERVNNELADKISARSGEDIRDQMKDELALQERLANEELESYEYISDDEKGEKNE